MSITFERGFSISKISGLYDFTTLTFRAPSTVSGSTPPTLAQFLALYTGSNTWASNNQYYTTASNLVGYQIWTVPQNATYEVEIAGSRSGKNYYPTTNQWKFGGGAIVKARLDLTQGQKIIIVTGQPGLDSTSGATSYNGIGGGGGTYFVLSGSNTPLLVAGGGGGYGAYASDSMTFGGILKSGSLLGNGVTTTSGSYSWHWAPGGTGSMGGRSKINTGSVVSSNIYDGGGGGGFSGSGFNGAGTVANTTTGQTGGGGLSFLAGGTGGVAASTYTPAQATVGGFGGGGGGTPIAGGGGGGYSGGGGSWGSSQPASDGAGGGGSYIISTATTISTSDGKYENLTSFSGSAITNLNSYNSGSGYIKITKL